MKKSLNNKFCHSLLVGLAAGVTVGILGPNALIYYLISYILAKGAKKLAGK